MAKWEPYTINRAQASKSDVYFITITSQYRLNSDILDAFSARRLKLTAQHEEEK